MVCNRFSFETINLSHMITNLLPKTFVKMLQNINVVLSLPGMWSGDHGLRLKTKNCLAPKSWYHTLGLCCGPVLKFYHCKIIHMTHTVDT